MAFGILDRATDTAPGLTVPEITLTFGGDSGGGGALGGIADAVGLGGGGPGLADGLVGLRLHRGVAPDVDWAEMVLVPVPGGAEIPAAGDTGEVGLAAGDGTAAFACTVDLVETRADGTVRLTATNGGRALARARLARSFAEQSSGEIIDALCAEFEVDSDAGSVGGTLPQYVLGEGRAVIDHIAALAASAGRLAVFGDDGALGLLDDTASGEPIPLALGGALLDARLGARAETGQVTVDGAGVGEQGGNAWAWLRKEAGPHRAEAGTAPPKRRIAAPWLRAPDAAADFAAAAARAFERDGAPGRLLAVSVPGAVPGAVVELSGTAQDGPWLVLSVDLTFTPETGLLSEIRVAPLDGGGGGLGGLL